MSHPFEVHHRYHSQGLAAGGSALLDAINKGKVHLAKFILDAGEYDVVNTRDFNGKTPLIRACYIKEEKTRGKAFQLLLDKGANVNLQDSSGRTALSYACEMRCNDIVRVLVKNNVDPDIADNKGNTALIYSAMVGNDTAIEILIRSFRRLGLNINHQNADHLTALLVAARHGFLECATLLATDGRADVTIRDPETGRTAEQWARSRGCTKQEVLSFAVSAQSTQQRQARCGSIYNRSTAMEGQGQQSSTADNDGEMASGGTEDRLSQLPVSVKGISGGVRQVSCVSESAAAESGWRGVLASRRKRNSLPCIRLYSSLDSPGACYTGNKQAVANPSEQTGDKPISPALAESETANENGTTTTMPLITSGSSVLAKLPNAHMALCARRSREFVRADTEILPPLSLEDEC